MNPSLEIVQPELNRKAVVYLRVSTKEQAERNGDPEGYSIPAQREACLRKAHALGAQVVEVYVDRGESARSADRPELQRMLADIDENMVDFVIVHKIDRLARNRMDDVTITASIRTSGAQLVSVTENIDETPQGALLHGIMSSIAEWYSRNLAVEVQKGMDQKVAAGGTNGRAPIGYLNILRVDDGREIRTVDLDPDRAPLIRAAFEAYATGAWSLSQLADELNVRGLRSRATRAKPAQPMTPNKLQTILRNRYYLGIVTWKGVEYTGRHPALVEPDLFEAVQSLLDLRRTAADHTQKHDHYLSGTLRCGRCGERLLFGYGKSKSGQRYPYYFCFGRHRTHGECTLPYIQVARIEAKVASLWKAEVLEPAVTHDLEQQLAKDLEEQNADTLRRTRDLTKEIERLKRERFRWADMVMAGSVPADIARERQQQLAEQLGAAESSLARVGSVQRDAMSTLAAALRLLERCADVYARHDDNGRRLMNQACFSAIEVDTDGKTLKLVVQRQPLFTALQEAAEGLQEARHEEAPDGSSGAWDRNELVACSNNSILVGDEGLEPPTLSV